MDSVAVLIARVPQQLKDEGLAAGSGVAAFFHNFGDGQFQRDALIGVSKGGLLHLYGRCIVVRQL